MKIRKLDVGRWVSVKWTCVGRRDCLLVSVDVLDSTGRVYEPYNADGLRQISLNQIVDVRDYLNAS